MARGDLTDAQYERLEPLLPSSEGKRGRPWRNHRQVINGILWIERTGAPWEDLPERYGPYTTCNDRLIRWKDDHTWERILQTLQSKAQADGKIVWEGCALDGSIVKAHPHAAGARKAASDAPPALQAPQEQDHEGKKGETKQPVPYRRRRPVRPFKARRKCSTPSPTLIPMKRSDGVEAGSRRRSISSAMGKADR
jgi:transposase